MRSLIGRMTRSLDQTRLRLIARARERLRPLLLRWIELALVQLMTWHDRLTAGAPRPDRYARAYVTRDVPRWTRRR